jgi:hypothetical protein
MERSAQKQWLLWQLSWIVPGLAATGLFTWLAKSSKSDDLSGPLSVALASSALILGILSFRRDLYGIEIEFSAPRELRRTLRRIGLRLPIVFPIVGAVFCWMMFHKPDIHVTDRVLIVGGQGMRDGTQATIQIPGGLAGRSHLALTPTLTNPLNVGDCVGAAQLTLTPVINGEQRRPVDARPGREARLNISGASDAANLLVTLHEQDSLCTVNLGIGEAALYS